MPAALRLDGGQRRRGSYQRVDVRLFANGVVLDDCKPVDRALGNPLLAPNPIGEFMANVALCYALLSSKGGEIRPAKHAEKYAPVFANERIGQSYVLRINEDAHAGFLC